MANQENNFTGKIDLNIIEDRITNIEAIAAILNTNDLNEELITQIKTLKNHLDSLDIFNKNELIEILDSKIIEYETKEQETINNQEALKMLKSLNPDYQKLGIISTKREDNDSNKYIDYLTYTNETGEIEVLSCDKKSTLNDFIQANKNTLPKLSAKDIFHYFKYYVHRNLEFQNLDAYIRNENKRKNAIVNDPEIEKQELEDVEEYKKRFGIEVEIQLSIDINGERIYRLGDGIIKFKNENERRTMQVLKSPTIKPENTYDSMLSELNETPEIKPEEITVMTENTRANAYSYSSLENITEENLDKERIIELISKRDVYDVALSYDEEHELNVYIKYLLSCMEFSIEHQEQVDENTKLVTEIMESKRGDKPSIIETYESIKSGVTKPNDLTDLEKEFAKRYLNNKEKIKTLGLDNNINKQLLLNEPNTKPNGITTVVLLLELIALAMFILMFLRLDI